MRLFAWACLLGVLGCKQAQQQEEPTIETADNAAYIFVAHMDNHSPDGQQMDPRLERLDLLAYDMRMIGGDVTVQTTLEYQNLAYVDRVLHIKHPQTHWAVGNHDVNNPEFIEQYTGKPLYYNFHLNGVTGFVVDSQQDSCYIRNEQKQRLESTLDTLENSTHFILMSHKLIWWPGNAELEQHDTLANGHIGYEGWNTIPNNFYSEIYPQLVALEERGIEVICIAGDIGNYVKRLEHETQEGVTFLASGLSQKDTENDEVLVLRHNLKTKQITWEFSNLDGLLQE